MLFVVLGIYFYPSARTASDTGFRGLPPNLAPDASLYLNISQIPFTGAETVTDPYYGIQVPVARMGYLKFRLAFLLFGYLSSLLHGNLWWSLLLWNILWWSLLFFVAVWILNNVLPDASLAIIAVGLALLFFADFGVLQAQFAALFRPSLRAFQSLQLPYLRPFFPQTFVPLLILYLGMQIAALRRRTAWPWIVMGATQFLAFTIFPYAMLVMAGITAIALAGHSISVGNHLPKWTALFYATACGLVDLLFFFHGHAIARTGAPGDYPLFHLQFSVLPHRIGGMWLFLAVLTAAMFAARDLTPEVRWSLVGLGLANLILLCGDVVFSETALQLSHHAGYFVQVTTAILLTVVLSAFLRRMNKYRSICRVAISLLGVALVLNGAMIAHATYLTKRAANRELSELDRILQSDPPASDDLVIVRSVTVDDLCAWAPLASRSHVLFCRNAQVLLSPKQNQGVQRLRQAFYLYFTGRDARWVENVLDDPTQANELPRLTFLGQSATHEVEGQATVNSVRSELIPMLDRVERNDSTVQSFFRQYRRIIVIESAARPLFDDSRLAGYLNIERQATFQEMRILHCAAR